MTVNLEDAYRRQWFTNHYGAVKHPDDLDRYRLIVEQTAPEVVVETGTAHGGGARFFLDLGCDVITIDLKQYQRPSPEVTYLVGNSVAPHIVAEVLRLTAGRRTMVTLDSDHSTTHVTAEIEVYAPMVTSGCYCVVEDGIVSFYNPAGEDGSPRDAALAYFPGRAGWTHDDEIAALTPITLHPDGWWKRG